VSRLARNSTDWHRLLEICALAEETPRPRSLAEVIFVAMAKASGAAWRRGSQMLQCQDSAYGR
jgi:hypothetical protein